MLKSMVKTRGFFFIVLIMFSFGSMFRVANASEAWLVDIVKAMEQSSEEKKPIFVNFTGSDWCPGCVVLEEKVFSQDEFKEYAQKNLVLLTVDFPNDKEHISAVTEKQNEQLMAHFKVRGFPTLLLLDSDGSELGRTSMPPLSPKEFIKMLDDFDAPSMMATSKGSAGKENESEQISTVGNNTVVDVKSDDGSASKTDEQMSSGTKE